MFDWYMKKLDEFIHVTQYCHHSVLEAHMVLARSATQEYLGQGDPDSKTALCNVIRLSAEQAKFEGMHDEADQLLSIAASIETNAPKTQGCEVVPFPSYRSNSVSA